MGSIPGISRSSYANRRGTMAQFNVVGIYQKLIAEPS